MNFQPSARETQACTHLRTHLIFASNNIVIDIALLSIYLFHRFAMAINQIWFKITLKSSFNQ